MKKNEEVKVEYYENGNKKYEIHCKDGERDGDSTFWFENGQLKECAEYKNGLMHGNWVGYYENGERLCSSVFEDGEKVFSTPINCGTVQVRGETE